MVRFSNPSWHPKSIKIDANMRPILGLILGSFFINFCFQLRLTYLEKSSSRCSQSTIFRKSPIEVDIDVCSDLGAHLAPFGSKSRPKSVQKSPPKTITFLIDFRIDIWPIWGPSWGPSWGHVGKKPILGGHGRRSKTTMKFDTFRSRFGTDFGAIWGANTELKFV